MRIIGIESEGAGTNNQIRGIILEGAKNDKLPSTRENLLKAEDGTLLLPKNYASATEFKAAVEVAVTNFCHKSANSPE